MLTEICAELRNWFVVPNGVHIQTYTISGGSIAPLDFLQEGQYFRIVGSVFNDGVYQYPDTSLTDEVFEGAVWALAIPKSLLDLVAEIEDWSEKNASAQNTPYQSESFGGYSYTLKNGADGATWKTVFASRLNTWRKL